MLRRWMVFAVCLTGFAGCHLFSPQDHYCPAGACSKELVVDGGVDTDELSSKTMEARKVPGLYFVGEVMDVTGETQETLNLYGVTPGKPSFGANCLLARRLVERIRHPAPRLPMGHDPHHCQRHPRRQERR